MIQDKTGYIVSADDAAAFVSRVIEMYDDRNLLVNMRKNARDYMVRRALESNHHNNWEYYQNLRN